MNHDDVFPAHAGRSLSEAVELRRYSTARRAQQMQRVIERYIREQVALRRLRPGDAVPSVRKAARMFDVSPGTVEHVYASLIRCGFLIAKWGRGTFVSTTLQREISRRERLLEDAAAEFASLARAVGAPLDEAARQLASAFDAPKSKAESRI